MGISDQDFRIRIGMFYTANMKSKFKVKYEPKNTMMKNCVRTVAFYLTLMLLMNYLLANPTSEFKKGKTNLKYNLEKCCVKMDYLKMTKQNYSICWSQYGLSINKMQKIINGNRRSVGYKLAAWNCSRGLIQDGFSCKLLEIKQFLQSKKPHCFAVIEADIYSTLSHINRNRKYSTAEVREKLKFDGYKIEFPSTWDRHGQARLICYVSDEIKYKRKTLNDGLDHIPSITLEVGLGRATKTTVHYYYREWTNGVTGESSKASQLVQLEEHVSQWDTLVRSSRNFVALGDANICALQWNDPSYRNKDLANIVQTFLLRESCVQLVKQITRVQSVGGVMQRSCIDHVTTNIPEKCSVPEVHPQGSSDHMPVMVTKFSREVKTQPKTIKKRNYKNFNAPEFLKEINELVQNGGFDRVLDNNNVEEASALFSGIFGSVLNKHAPLKVFQVRNNYVPWVSDNTKKMQAARDTLKKEASDENCNEKFEAYKRLRNRIIKQLEKDEVEYYKTKFYQENPSVSAVWKNVNDYLNTSKRSFNNTPNLIVHNNEAHTKPRDIANAINEAFIKKVKDLRAKVTETANIDPKERLQEFLDKRTEEIPLFNLKKINLRKLRKLLKKRKGNRSCGIDYIDGYSIKLAAPLIEDILLHLVNTSIDNSIYPSLWKVNKVSPQFKNGDKTLGENWRPVTDIVFVSKLAEAAVFEQVEEHFSSNNLWHPNHHGFKANHSTSTAISQIYDFWIKAAENTELTAALLLDLSAAFDVVDHEILLDKLELYKFSPQALLWFRSYLQGRKQVVVIESKISDTKDVGEQAVPQGSLLGPILFIIFYNDFPEVRHEGSSIIYADDDTDNVSGNDPINLQQKIQREADLSTSWVKDNKLVCSGKKTKLLIVGTKELRKSKLINQDITIKINVDGHEVKESESERLLGILMNNTMTWEHHLYGNDEHRGLIPKLSQRSKIIWKLSKIMPQKRLKMISEGIFFSLLNYCIEIFGNVWGLDVYDDKDRKSTAFTKDDNMKLQVIVNNVLRSLTGLDRDTPVTTLHSASNLLSVHQRCAFYTLTSVHKAIKHQQPAYSFSKLQPNPATVRNTGATRVDYKLSISRGSYYYRGSRLYNKLPDSLHQSANQSTFKKEAKKWVIRNIPVLPP